ncbi:hypothetical protein DV736_g2840, partial [Chaetothyriales sp. CBS 134916]
MGRSIDQDVHAAFVEFRAKAYLTTEDDKCLSVQCIYCQQIRAKNTSRQKQHLLECPGLQNQPNAARPPSSSDGIAGQNGFATPSQGLNAGHTLPNGTPQGTPMQSMASRPSLPPSFTPHGSGGPSSLAPTVPRSTPKPKTTPTPKQTPGTASLPAPPLDDVHAAFVEFRAKEEDKCLSVQCIYCNQIRAKNTSRQRQHLLECQTYQNVMKEAIPANNLLHRFDENDIARSLQIPPPALELDFRMSIKLNPRVAVGPGLLGQRNWVSFVGGKWAGRWGKGLVIPGGQDSQLVLKDLATRVDANYLLQTQDDPPAYIKVKSQGWRTGAREVLEKLADPTVADTTPPTQYKFRIVVELESGDERYSFLNTGMWVGSGARRGGEVIYDAYRIN